MLTQEQIANNKIKFIELLSKLNIDLTMLMKYFEGTDYFNKPLSYKKGDIGYYAGGLCEHALKLYYELGMLCNAYRKDKYSEEDVIKVALFKDIYKAELYEAYYRNVKNDDTGNWESVIDYRIKEVRPTFGDLSFSSYMIAKHFIELNDEQIEAICMASSNESCGGDIHDIRCSYPLVTLTRMAEFASLYLED